MPETMLETLARAVAIVTVAGYQTPITIAPLGRTFDANRRVRVSRLWAPQDEHEADETRLPDVWEGPVEEWCEAVKRAALGIAGPSSDESWVFSIVNNNGRRDYRIDRLTLGDWPQAMDGMFIGCVCGSAAEAETRGQAFLRGDW